MIIVEYLYGTEVDDNSRPSDARAGPRAAAAAARPQPAQTPPNCRPIPSNDVLRDYGQALAHQVAVDKHYVDDRAGLWSCRHINKSSTNI